MTVVVTDTSPLVAFAFLKLEHLFPQMFGTLILPPTVLRETAHARFGFAGIDLSAQPYIVVRQPTDTQTISRLKEQIDAGEAEAIALAIEVKADLVLIDDAAARDVAENLGLTVTGTVGLLLRAKSSGYINSIRPLLDLLRTDLRFFISETLYARAIQMAGE